MIQHLETKSELMAEYAETLEAFSGVKLLHIKRQVELMLDLFGRTNIFDQYTRHNISHINKMLKLVEWIIPEETQETMTKADWLMLVLSIYFHDLGLLVTRQEFQQRHNNFEYKDYCNKVANGSLGTEFKEKVEQLEEDEKEYFLYQEFVRTQHAHRVKMWIDGNYVFENKECSTIVKEIDKLLSNLLPVFRRDLALVCESHHMDDLNDFAKYKTNVSYGSEDDETVNLHYIAIILRTADLLHITSDRTPSIQYRLINVSDPKSIIEWQKQHAVRAVKPRMPRDIEGNVDITLPKDTIEITAYFESQPEAYFGLMYYLMYAKAQIIESYEYVLSSQKTQGTQSYVFPWRIIDDQTSIEVSGFEKRQFQFTLDQSNILRLLVGHTLYSDASVVVRELIQNGIDALKFQNKLETLNNNPEMTLGEVKIIWSSSQRELTVIDNGTGMTINEIENYLLKVGKSKYQTNEFRKNYPDFSAISRFGIGILTCFMVADNVDIITNSVEEEHVNCISIRNVNGNYLLKKISKYDPSIDPHIRKHGTIIKLYVRSNIIISNILMAADKWVIVPSCRISLSIDENPPQKIGYDSPKQALVRYLENNNYQIDGKKYDVIERRINNITLAYAIKYSDHYNQWSFLINDKGLKLDNEDLVAPVGTCIEGIRVEFYSPGYNSASNSLLALANIAGNDIAQTNVARSAIEDINQGKMVKILYSIYKEHVENQINSLIDKGYSLYMAFAEVEHLIRPLISSFKLVESRRSKENLSILLHVLDDISCILLETDEGQKAVSPKYIKELDTIQIIDSQIVNEAQSLLTGISTDKTLRQLIEYIGTNLNTNCDSPTICNFSKSNILHRNSLQGKEAISINVDREQKRVEFTYKKSQNIWHSVGIDGVRKNNKTYYIPYGEFLISGLTGSEIGVDSSNSIYLSTHNELSCYIKSKLSLFDIDNQRHNQLLTFFLDTIFDQSVLELVNKNQKVIGNITNYRTSMNKRDMRNLEENLWAMIDKDEFVSIVFKDRYSLYNPHQFSRKVSIEA